MPVRTWRPAAPEWVYDPSNFGTGLLAWSLTHVPGTETIRERACDFLAAQAERHGVWRHWTRGHAQFHYVPPDLDDTSVISAALLTNGRRAPDNRRLLLSNRAPNGLFFSWITLRRYPVRDFAYWWTSLVHLALRPVKSIAFYSLTPSDRHDIDGVVNANTLFYLGRSADTEKVIAFLVDILRGGREAGCDKWYENPFVVWYFLSRALSRSGVDAADLILGRLESAAPQTPLERALALCVRMDWDVEPDAAAIAALLGAQQPGGGWPVEPFYKGARVRWGSEELTTGFCLEALGRWRDRQPR
jgi:hypothetical protein